MGYSLLFDLADILPKDVTNPLQYTLDLMKEFEPYPLGTEEMKIRICYPKVEFNKPNIEVYLFNKTINSSLNYVLTRTKNQDNSINVIISEVDENFITICEKTQMMNFRQVYSFDYATYKIGDIIVKIGSLYREMLQKSFLFEIVNPYGQTFEEIKDFSFDVMRNIFPACSNEDLMNGCLFDQSLMPKKESEVKNKELIQYVQMIFKKK